MNICRACSLDFCSVDAFDAHRVGKHAHLWSPERPDGRRCLSRAEISEAGWQQDARGRWVHPRALRNRPRNGRAAPPRAVQRVGS
jgi:hypothetical protein